VKQLLSMKDIPQKKLYEWQRGSSGSWHHWDMFVLHGNAVLHVQGSEDMGGYWGDIQLYPSYDPDYKSIFTTKSHLKYDLFRLPEYCAQYLENKWKEIISEEEKHKIFSVNDE